MQNVDEVYYTQELEDMEFPADAPVLLEARYCAAIPFARGFCFGLGTAIGFYLTKMWLKRRFDIEVN